jgi:NADPH2:quinone reductase
MREPIKNKIAGRQTSTAPASTPARTVVQLPQSDTRTGNSITTANPVSTEAVPLVEKPESPETMLAAVLTGPTSIVMKKVPLPIPADQEVRVRMEGCGICRSDLAAWTGGPGVTYPFEPGNPGHEAWGRVEAIGSKVATINVGDRVALVSHKAFAEFDVAPETAVVKLPANLEGPFPGAALGEAMNVFHRGDIRHGQTVAVVGIGFLGAVLTQLCVRAGANVIAISRRAGALELAGRMGATETLAFNDPAAIVQRVNNITANLLCDRVIEAVGHQDTLNLAAQLTRNRGRLIIAGYHPDSRQVDMPLWNARGLDVINAHESEMAVNVHGMQAAEEAIQSGVLDPTPLYTHRFTLTELPDAMKLAQERPATFLKALIRMT